MEEKELKTSPKQRFFIILIAVLMLGSMVASYALIVANGGNSGAEAAKSGVDEAKIAKYEEEYSEKAAELSSLAKSDFDAFVQYKSEIKAYNETAANENGVQTRDLKTGDGKKISDGDTDYLAYYVGWCADETVFDSTFDDAANPTGFVRALDPSLGMIEGWNMGVVGMKLGGVREITIAGGLAYGETRELCGGKSKPLKFIVMAVEKKDPLATTAKAVDEAYMKLQYAVVYGIDYDSLEMNAN